MGCDKLKYSLMNVNKIERMFDNHDNDWLYMITASCGCESGGVLTWVEYHKPEYSIGEEVSVTLKWHDEEAKQRIKECKGDIPMSMFKLFDEMLKELCDEYSMDEIMDAIKELAEEHMDDEDKSKVNDKVGSFECDGDCENCKYGTEQMDDYAYEYGYHDIPQDLEEFMDGKYDDVDNNNSNQYDSVNHPNYYVGKIEVIDFIEDKKLNYNLGNCVKYISRAGKKHEAGMSIQEKTLEDLRKARWYLNREISAIESNH